MASFSRLGISLSEPICSVSGSSCTGKTIATSFGHQDVSHCRTSYVRPYSEHATHTGNVPNSNAS